jgi:hypothetical protein
VFVAVVEVENSTKAKGQLISNFYACPRPAIDHNTMKTNE